MLNTLIRQKIDKEIKNENNCAYIWSTAKLYSYKYCDISYITNDSQQQQTSNMQKQKRYNVDWTPRNENLLQQVPNTR